MTESNPSRQLRNSIYLLLITVAVGSAVGRILATELVYEPSLHKTKEDQKAPRGPWPATRPNPLPTFSSNDRSRWATIRALVEEGTYVIGERNEEGKDRSIWQKEGWESGWDTVDKVLDPKTKKFYSSKPPLLSTLVAGLYWILQKITGWTFAANAWEIVRALLLLINALPYFFYLLLLSRLIEHLPVQDWTKFYLMTAACFATLVNPFLITLNNHTIACFCTLFSLYGALLILEHEEKSPGSSPWYWFAVSGILASFTACNELPATSFAALLGIWLVWKAPRQTLLFYLPAALIPVAGFFVANYEAIGQLRPAYAEFGTEWYKYPGSHWSNPNQAKKGIDFASHYESRWQYAFNVILGHHGLFSLTPIWILAFGGMIWKTLKRSSDPANEDITPLPTLFYPFTLILSVVVVGFYLYKSDNYGGWTAGLRWLMWLTPLWLLCLAPAAEYLGRTRIGRGIAAVLLGFSVLSVSYPAWNPWRHPWIFRWMDANGWIPY